MPNKSVAVHGQSQPDSAPDEPLVLLRELFDTQPVMRGVPRAIGYMIALPHREQRVSTVWRKDFGNFAFVVEPGRLFLHGDGEGTPLAVPSGPRARLLLAYLIAWSFDNGNYEVDRSGISLNRWAESFDLSIGGKTYAAFQDQELRLFSSHFITTFRDSGYEGAIWDQLCVNGMRPDPAQGAKLAHGKRNMVQLSTQLYGEIKAHPTRVPTHALSHLTNQSLGLDIYFWLAYRLPVMQDSEKISWDAIFECFGTSYRNQYHFQPRFIEKLQLALCAYPQAGVDIESDGLLLHPSPPPQDKSDRDKRALSRATAARVSNNPAAVGHVV